MNSHAAGARALGKFSVLAGSICLVLATSAWAQTTITITPEGQTGRVLGSDQYGDYKPQPDGTLKWKGDWTSAGTYALTWDLHMDPDPFVTGSLNLTNSSGVTTTFILSVNQPVAPAFPVGSLMSGVSLITLTDSNFNGVASVTTVAGQPIFDGTLDGVSQRKLFNDPYVLVPTFPPGGISDTQSFTNEITTLPLNSVIGIVHRFTLTPGDTITLNSTFIVVPEPATALLATLGAIGAWVSVRRRKV